MGEKAEQRKCLEKRKKVKRKNPRTVRKNRTVAALGFLQQDVKSTPETLPNAQMHCEWVEDTYYLSLLLFMNYLSLIYITYLYEKITRFNKNIFVQNIYIDAALKSKFSN